MESPDDRLCLIGGFCDWKVKAVHEFRPVNQQRRPQAGLPNLQHFSARLESGFISFQIVSSKVGFRLRIFPAAGKSSTLAVSDQQAVPARTGGASDGHGADFLINEAAGVIVTIYAELAAPGSGLATVRYELEQKCNASQAEVVTLREPRPHWLRQATLPREVRKALRSRNGAARLMANVSYRNHPALLSQATRMSTRMFPHAFGSGQVTLAVDPTGVTVLGYIVCETLTGLCNGGEPCLRVLQVAVLEDEQGKGLGRMLVDSVIAHARVAGLPFVHLDAFKSAVPFYEALGFYKLSPELEEMMPFYAFWPMEFDVKGSRE